MKGRKQHRRKTGQGEGVTSINFLSLLHKFPLLLSNGQLAYVSCTGKTPLIQVPLGSQFSFVSCWFSPCKCQSFTFFLSSIYIVFIFLYAVITCRSVPLPVLCYHVQSTANHVQTKVVLLLYFHQDLAKECTAIVSIKKHQLTRNHYEKMVLGENLPGALGHLPRHAFTQPGCSDL